MKARLMNARRLMYHLEIKSGAGYRRRLPPPQPRFPHPSTPTARPSARAEDVLIRLRRQNHPGAPKTAAVI